jgi:hypothetical protein
MASTQHYSNRTVVIYLRSVNFQFLCCGATIEKPIIVMGKQRRNRRRSIDSYALSDFSSDPRSFQWSHTEQIKPKPLPTRNVFGPQSSAKIDNEVKGKNYGSHYFVNLVT